MIASIYIYILYALLLFSVFFLFHDSIVYLVRESFWIFRRKAAGKTESRVYKHLLQLMEAISNDVNIQKKTNALIGATIGIFLIFSLLLIRQGYGFVGILTSVLLASLPYAYLRSKLATIRLVGSFEGEAVISEFVYQYKQNAKNIITTIDSCTKSLSEKEPVSKKAFYKMSMRIKTAKDQDEIYDILNDFVYATNTDWARTLAENIFNAVDEKADIINGVEDLLRECKKINENLEKVKRTNLEASAMIKFAGPAFFIGFAYMAKTSSGLSWKTIANYEFNTPTGLLLFVLTVAVMFLNMVIVNLVTKQKYDI